jgi:hypothetical protein
LNPDTKEKPRPSRETKHERKEWQDRQFRSSLAFYAALLLLFAQFAANAIGHVPFNTLFLVITGAVILGLLFGSQFVVDLARAIRGSRDDSQGGDDDA